MGRIKDFIIDLHNANIELTDLKKVDSFFYDWIHEKKLESLEQDGILEGYELEPPECSETDIDLLPIYTFVN